MTKSFRRLFFFILFNMIFIPFLFIFFEGLCSTIVLTKKFIANKPTAERRHTQYDADIGWTNIPNIIIPDMYGQGRSLSINSQGFRSVYNFPKQIVPNKIRIICSGDSFTLGYGVGDDHTWSHRLAEENEHIETINMGQGGYGVDQAYLWFKRDGVVFDHHVHILAFITTDFDRMKNNTFEGYGKPLLTINEGKMIITNVPVPRRAYYMPWLTSNRQTFSELNCVKFYRTFWGKKKNKKPSEGQLTTKQIQETLHYIFTELNELHNSNNRLFVLVYLPNFMDYKHNHSLSWVNYISNQAVTLNIHFINLIEELRKIPEDLVPSLFLKDDPTRANAFLPFAHYSNDGNAYIADCLYHRLLEIPEFQVLIQSLSDRDLGKN